MSEVQTSKRGASPPADSKESPRLLVVGHLAEDVETSGSRLGGAAAYAGLLGLRFGAAVDVLTAVDAAFPFLDRLAGVRIVRLRSAGRTRFENRYDARGKRSQRILTVADPIPEAAVEDAVRRLPPGSAVLYAPVANEIPGARPLPRPPGPDGPAAAAIQGFLRRVGPDGRVVLPDRAPGLARRFRSLDFACLSEEELIPGLADRIRNVVITRGRRGARFALAESREFDLPAFPAVERDPTGAGDVFAAALLIGRWRGADWRAAGRLAAAAAALTVEAAGVAGVPTLAAARRMAGRATASAGGSRPGSPAPR